MNATDIIGYSYEYEIRCTMLDCSLIYTCSPIYATQDNCELTCNNCHELLIDNCTPQLSHNWIK